MLRIIEPKGTLVVIPVPFSLLTDGETESMEREGRCNDPEHLCREARDGTSIWWPKSQVSLLHTPWLPEGVLFLCHQLRASSPIWSVAVASHGLSHILLCHNPISSWLSLSPLKIWVYTGMGVEKSELLFLNSLGDLSPWYFSSLDCEIWWLTRVKLPPRSVWRRLMEMLLLWLSR